MITRSFPGASENDLLIRWPASCQGSKPFKPYREMLGQLTGLGGWNHYYAGLPDKAVQVELSGGTRDPFTPG